MLEVGPLNDVLDLQILTFDDGGSDPDVVEGTIAVDDIINTSSADGAISFSVSSASIEEVLESSETDEQRDEIQSTITGTPTITLQTGFFRVTIKNQSDFDLVLNKMDVVNEAADPDTSIFVSDADDASIDLTNVTTTPGATRIEIDNVKLVTFAGAIENNHGITEVTSRDEQIVSSGDGVIQSNELILSALSGTIGTGSTDRLATKSSDVSLSTLLTATALNDIHMSQAGVPDPDDDTATIGGDIDVRAVRSLIGLVDLQANGSILDASRLDAIVEDLEPDLRADRIRLDSLAAAIGSASNHLEIDTASATEAVGAEAATGIYLTEMTGDLNIVTLTDSATGTALAGIRTTDTPGDIVLAVQDADEGEQDLRLLDGQAIQSDEGSITLNVGDDVAVPEGAGLVAGASISILVDQEPFDVGFGSIVDLLGTITTGTETGDTFTITGGDHGDTINITHLCGAPTFVLTGLGSDEINIASALNRLDLILDPLHIDGGTGDVDMLNLNASGFMFALDIDLAADLDGAVLPQGLLDAFATSAKPLTSATPTATVLAPGARWRIHDDTTTFLAIVENNVINVYDEGNAENTAGALAVSTATEFEGVVTRFGMGTNAAVHHKHIEFLNIDLGTADDTVTVGATADHTVTTIASGAGDDAFTVGGAAGAGVANVDGTLVLDGGSDDDTLTIDDTPNTTDRIGALGGILEEFRLSGMDMGEPTEGVNFGSFESLNVNLGSGADELTVQGLNTDAVVRLGDGGGTVRLGAGDPDDGIEDDLSRISANLDLRGSTTDQDALIVNASLSANISIDTGDLDLVGTPGEVTFTDFDDLDVNLGAANDRVTVVDTLIPLEIVTGSGADVVIVETIRADTDIDLGPTMDSDGDNDQVTVLDAAASLDIFGDASGIDEVIVDQSARTDAIEPGPAGIDPPTLADHPTDPDTGVLSDVTTGDITFSAITRFGLLLGSGNDVVAIDLGPNLSTNHPTIVTVDGGGGNDVIHVRDLDSETIVEGGDQDDTVTVVIDGFPTADQFANLGLDVETLVVDNTMKADAANTDSVAWSLVDDILGADVVAANPPSPLPPATPFAIMDASGAEMVRIRGGSTQLDTLDVGTNTINDVEGFVDRPDEDGVLVNRVTLEYGAVVLEADAAATFRQPQVAIDFDELRQTAQVFETAGYRITTDGGFTVDTSSGTDALGTGLATDTLTLADLAGNGITLDAVTFRATTSDSVEFVAKRFDGSRQTESVAVTPATGRQTLSTLSGAESISWSLPDGIFITLIEVSLTRTLEFDDVVTERSTYNEDGFTLSTEGLIAPSLGGFRFVDEVDTFTLTAAGDAPFTPRSIVLDDPQRDFARPITFTGTDSSGGTVEETLGYGNPSFSSPQWDDIVALSWDMRRGQVADTIIASDGTDRQIDFDALIDGATTYDEDGFTLSTDGALRSVDGGVGIDVPETITLTSGGGEFTMTSISLLDQGLLSPQSITFIGTKSDDSTVERNVPFDGNLGFETVAIPDMTDVVSVEFILNGSTAADMITFAGATSTNLAFDALPAQLDTYVEDGLSLSTPSGLVVNDLQSAAAGTASMTETVELRSTTGRAIALYSIDFGSTTPGTYDVPFTFTTVNGTEIPEDESTLSVTIPDDGTLFATTTFAGLNQIATSITWRLPDGLFMDNIIAVDGVPSLLEFDDVQFSQNPYEEAGFVLTTGGFGFAPASGGIGARAVGDVDIRAANGVPFSLASADIRIPGINPQPLTFTGTTINGGTVRETLTIQPGGYQPYAFTALDDLVSVSYRETGNAFDLDNLLIEQAILSSAPAATMPLPVTAVTDESTAVSLRFDTGDLTNGPRADDQPRLFVNDMEVDGTTGFNGTPFTVSYLNNNENVVDTPADDATYIARYTFHGDFFVPGGSLVQVEGNNSLSIVVENDATLGADVDTTLTFGGAAAATVSTVDIDFTSLNDGDAAYTEDGYVIDTTESSFQVSGGGVVGRVDEQFTVEEPSGFFTFTDIDVTSDKDVDLFFTGVTATGDRIRVTKLVEIDESSAPETVNVLASDLTGLPTDLRAVVWGIDGDSDATVSFDNVGVAQANFTESGYRVNTAVAASSTAGRLEAPAGRGFTVHATDDGVFSIERIGITTSRDVEVTFTGTTVDGRPVSSTDLVGSSIDPQILRTPELANLVIGAWSVSDDALGTIRFDDLVLSEGIVFDLAGSDALVDLVDLETIFVGLGGPGGGDGATGGVGGDAGVGGRGGNGGDGGRGGTFDVLERDSDGNETLVRAYPGEHGDSGTPGYELNTGGTAGTGGSDGTSGFRSGIGGDGGRGGGSDFGNDSRGNGGGDGGGLNQINDHTITGNPGEDGNFGDPNDPADMSTGIILDRLSADPGTPGEGGRNRGTTDATVALTLVSNPTDGDSITIGLDNYIFRDAIDAMDRAIRIGETRSETYANLIAAITGTGDPRVDYSSDIAASLDVTIGNFRNERATLTALQRGAAGNGLVVSSDFTNTTDGFDAGALSGGVDTTTISGGSGGGGGGAGGGGAGGIGGPGGGGGGGGGAGATFVPRPGGASFGAGGGGGGAGGAAGDGGTGAGGGIGGGGGGALEFLAHGRMTIKSGVTFLATGGRASLGVAGLGGDGGTRSRSGRNSRGFRNTNPDAAPGLDGNLLGAAGDGGHGVVGDVGDPGGMRDPSNTHPADFGDGGDGGKGSTGGQGGERAHRRRRRRRRNHAHAHRRKGALPAQHQRRSDYGPRPLTSAGHRGDEHRALQHAGAQPVRLRDPRSHRDEHQPRRRARSDRARPGLHQRLR